MMMMMLGLARPVGRLAGRRPLGRGRRRLSVRADDAELIYEGPFGGVLRRLKRVSVFSCASTLVSVPLLSVYGNEDMERTQRVAVGFTVCSFAILTTAALNFISKPYIWRMYRLPLAKQSVSAAAAAAAPAHSRSVYSAPLVVESLNLFGRIKTTEIPNGLDDVYGCKERVFVNFGIRGKPPMYVHEDGDCFADEELFQNVMKRIKIDQPDGEQKQ